MTTVTMSPPSERVATALERLRKPAAYLDARQAACAEADEHTMAGAYIEAHAQVRKAISILEGEE